MGTTTPKRLTAVLFLCLAGSVAEAREPGIAPLYPPGQSLGSPVAFTPPPGLVMVSRSSYGNAQLIDHEGRTAGRHQNSAVEALHFILVPGWELFGAKVRLSALQPFIYLQQDRGAPLPAAMRGSASLFGLANTKVTPIDLAWSLGDGLFVSTAFGIYAPTGYWGANTPLDTGANFWTFEPSAALTYFRDGWNATLHALYNTNTWNPSNHYYSGDQLFLNGTVTKNFNGFDIGPVSYYLKQVTPDLNAGGRTSYGGINFPSGELLAVGLSIAHRIGKAYVQFMFTQDVYARSNFEGSKVWLNLSFKLF